MQGDEKKSAQEAVAREVDSFSQRLAVAEAEGNETLAKRLNKGLDAALEQQKILGEPEPVENVTEAAAALAAEEGVDLSVVEGSGVHGDILVSDVKEAAAEQAAEEAPAEEEAEEKKPRSRAQAK